MVGWGLVGWFIVRFGVARRNGWPGGTLISLVLLVRSWESTAGEVAYLFVFLSLEESRDGIDGTFLLHASSSIIVNQGPIALLYQVNIYIYIYIYI